MSLNERFSNLRAPVLARNSSAKLQGRRQNAAVLQKASSKNLRLLKQMEKRSSVNAAALKIKKKSIKQRLGGQPTFNTRTKLRGSLAQTQRNLSTTRLRNVVGKAQSTRNQAPNGKPSLRGKTATTTKAGSKPANLRGRNPQVVKKSRGVPKTQSSTTNNQRGKGSPTKQTQRVRGQASPRGTTNSRGRGRGSTGGRGRGATVGRGRGPTGGRGRGGGRGGSQTSKVSKEDLDKQLDQYMSGTRHSLDQELDGYMTLKDVEMN